MISSELRVGNYVSQSNAPFKEGDSVVIITPLNFSEFQKFKPIEITKEWLSKFRFKQKSPCFLLGAPFYYLDIEESKRYKFNIHRFIIDVECKDLWLTRGENEDSKNVEDIEIMINYNIKYVHQLQNVYYTLTGSELNIEDINNKLITE